MCLKKNEIIKDKYMAAEKVKEFNLVLESFVQQMAPFIGSTYGVLLGQVVRANALLPIQKFQEYVVPHTERIMIKDEGFFLNDNNTKEILTGVDDQDIFDEIFKMKNVWANLSAESKENIWSYFQALVILCQEYLQTKGRR